MEALRIHFFGGFLLERGGVALPPIASRAGRSLFAYLVMHRGRPQHREVLAGTFWPELSEGRARRRLSHTLWQIQDVVSTDSSSFLNPTTDTLTFDTQSAYWLDVEEFDRHVAISEESPPNTRLSSTYRASVLRACVDLYRGDFLAGYFDDWVVVEQDHYRQRYLTALDRLVEATKSAGAYEEALDYARRLTHYDPLSEEAHQEVMRLCYLLGRTSDAVEQFRRCRSVLEEELGAEPSPATVEIYERIVKQRRAGIRANAAEDGSRPLDAQAVSPFVGREDERRLLIDAIERVLAGPGGVALIEGEPGVGKTRLATEISDDARWRGFEVSWGSCRPGALRPFAPLVEILESLSSLRLEQLAEQVAPVWFNQALRLAPELVHRVAGLEAPAALRPAEELTRTQESLVHTLGALGRIAPHLVIIDDVQWADRDTLSVLTQLAARLTGTRVLVLLVFRSEEARGEPEIWDVIRDLDRVSGLGRAVLSPLSVFELEEMVRRMLDVPRLQPSVATRLHRETGGNALFALETLLAMRDRGSLDTGADPLASLDSSAPAKELPVAPRVRAVIESRISLLGDEIAGVYEVASVIGDPVRLELLEACVEKPRSIVLDAVDELLHRGLLREQGDGAYLLAHDQVRQVVYEGINAPRRHRLHQVVADNLVRIDPERVEDIGHHFRQADDLDRAAQFLLKAGLRAIELSAYSTARNQLQAARGAANEASWPDLARYQLLGHLEDVLGVLGRRGEQLEMIEEMSPLVDETTRGDFALRRAWLLAHGGRLAEAEEVAVGAVDVERANVDEAPAISEALVVLGTVKRWSGRPLDAVPDLKEAVAAAKGDESQLAIALTELASTLVEVQRSDQAFAHLEDALDIYRRNGDLRGEAEVGGIRARALHRQGRGDEASDQYRLTIELCRRIGYRHGEGVNLTNLANLQQLQGMIADALDGYSAAAQIFSELGNRRGEAMVLVNSAWARHSVLGDDQRAKTDVTRAMGLFEEIGDRARQAQCQEILAGVEARAGHHTAAESLIQKSLSNLDGTGNVVLEVQHLRSLALLHIETGEWDQAAQAVDRAEELAVGSGLENLAVELLSIRGVLLIQRGELEEGFSLTGTAVGRLAPGVEHPHLVHLRHALAAEKLGAREEASMAALEAKALLDSALTGLADVDRERALATVPENRLIFDTADRYSPVVIEVELPSMHAPMGKQLTDDDMKTVVWTVEHPSDKQISSATERRRSRLLRLLAEAGTSGASASLDTLARVLGVSASTVRRDLAVLRDAGHDVASRGQTHQAS